MVAYRLDSVASQQASMWCKGCGVMCGRLQRKYAHFAAYRCTLAAQCTDNCSLHQHIFRAERASFAVVTNVSQQPVQQCGGAKHVHSCAGARASHLDPPLHALAYMCTCIYVHLHMCTCTASTDCLVRFPHTLLANWFGEPDYWLALRACL